MSDGSRLAAQSGLARACSRPAARVAIVIWVALLVLAALGWAVTVFAARSMGQMADMPGMPAASFSGSQFLSVWTAMMVAMMFPSIAPIATALTVVGDSRRQAGQRAAPTWIFLLGYLTVWCVVGVGAYLLSLVVPDAGMAAPGVHASRPVIGGIILILAGVYQWSPLKKLFLGSCRSPLGVLQEWGKGTIGTFRLGITHGAQCVGCCGGLMLVLFAVGVMNLGWMALLAAVIFAEKVVPHGPDVGKLAGAALLVSGIVMLGT